MPRYGPVMHARVLAFTLAAGAALALPAAAQAQALPRVLTRHTMTCHQTYASFAPNGRLDHYGDSAAWTVRLYPTGDHYDAQGEGIDPQGALAGPMTYRNGRATFTDGPFHNRKAGWVLVGRYVKKGARMPHDPKRSRRFPFVLRSATNRHAELAPPRLETNVIARSFFYCR